jgi:hypothetical protein
MSRENTSNSKVHRLRMLEREIGNLTHRFLSAREHDESLRIATNLIDAIRELVDERRD